MTIFVTGLNLLILSILVLYLGIFLNRKIKVLDKYNIPAPVTGGLLFSLFATILNETGLLVIDYNLELRDLLLLMFFSTVGLSARFDMLLSGGKTLLVLLVVMLVFLVLQNTLGISAALLMGETPEKGLLAGSISMAGGHGTAITWGLHFEGMGYQGAQEYGLVAATLGLIFGGLIGGPVAHKLIMNHKLHGHSTEVQHVEQNQTECEFAMINLDRTLRVLLEIATTITVGLVIHGWLKKQGLVVPSYLPVLFVGIIITNIATLFKNRADESTMNLWGEISLSLFITMSLMSLQLSALTGTASSILVIIFLQCILAVVFAYYILFRLAGKDYDAAVICAGFIGSGLGATPVGMANVEAITQRYGNSMKALLIIPLLGSFFTDVLNALVLRSFLELPFF